MTGHMVLLGYVLKTNSLVDTVNNALVGAGLEDVALEEIKGDSARVYAARVIIAGEEVYRGVNLKQAKIWLMGYLAGLTEHAEAAGL